MKPSQSYNPRVRHLMIWGLMLALGVTLIWRLSELHLIDDDFLQLQGDKRSQRTISVSAHRGMILDRNHEPLAISTPIPSVWVNPKQVKWDQPAWAELSQWLSLSSATLTDLQTKSNKSFVYLQRHISPNLAEKIKGLNLSGVYIQTEYKRFYPTAEVTAHILGKTNVDDHGVEGIELAFDDLLSGKAGSQKVVRNRLGHQVEALDEYRPATPGQDLTLSVDSRLQYLAYRELLKAVKTHNAKSGSIVVLDAETFEVLAMANAPSYNPNLNGIPYTFSKKNRAVTDQFEPGSVIKPISMAHILASGAYYPHTPVDTSPGYIHIAGKKVQDVRNFGKIDVGTVIKKSSNVGISKLLLSLPPENFYKTLTKVGFGERTQSGFPGEASGHIQYDGQHNPFALATLGFGYGISATPLQLAKAYAILASGGLKKPISFVKQATPRQGERVISQAISASITDMLVTTTQAGGTAYQAQVPGYTVAGKTGTARKIGPNGYLEDSHLALFAGFAPAENPKIVIAVVIDEPKAGHYYGGQVAAPVFSSVMAAALRVMDVSPWGYSQDYLLVKK